MIVELMLVGAVSGNWPMWGGEPTHQSLQLMKGAITTTPVVKWSFITGNYVEWQFSAIADCDGDMQAEVIFGSCDYKLYCVDGSTGLQQWAFTTGNRIYSSPAIANLDADPQAEVVFGSNDYKVYCLDGSSGAQQWAFTTGNYVYSSPAIADVDGDGQPEVVVGSDDSKVYCLNGLTGAQEWVATRTRYVYSSPAIADVDGDGQPEVVVGGGDSTVFCLNGSTGAQEWSFLTGSNILSSPGIADVDGDGQIEVVFGSNDYNVYSLDGSTGAQEWVFATGDIVTSSPAIGDLDGDGQIEIAIGSYDMRVYSLNGSTGAQEWSYLTSGVWLHNPLSIADVDGDDKLEVFAPNVEMGPDTLYCLNTENGTALWKKAVGWDVHAAFTGDIDGDGCIEVLNGTADGYLYALEDPGNEQGCGDLYTDTWEKAVAGGFEFRAKSQGLCLFLPEQAQVSLSLYDASGRLVQNLYDGLLPAGGHSFIPSTGARGVYLAVLVYPEGVQTVKLVR